MTLQLISQYIQYKSIPQLVGTKGRLLRFRRQLIAKSEYTHSLCKDFMFAYVEFNSNSVTSPYEVSELDWLK